MGNGCGKSSLPHQQYSDSCLFFLKSEKMNHLMNCIRITGKRGSVPRNYFFPLGHSVNTLASISQGETGGYIFR